MQSIKTKEKMPRSAKRRAKQRGGSVIEFALSTIFWVPLLLGVLTVGFKLIEADRAAEICRDTGHMYAYGTDFSQPASQTLAQRLAAGYDLSSTGNGLLTFTVVKMIGSNECSISGYVPSSQTPNSSNCPNLGKYVIAQRLYIGNMVLYKSVFGAPNSTLLDSQGNVSLVNQVSNVGLQTSSFGNLLTLTASQFSYLTEAFFSNTNFDGSAGPGVYTRAIF
jgi:hypothetical protein